MKLSQRETARARRGAAQLIACGLSHGENASVSVSVAFSVDAQGNVYNARASRPRMAPEGKCAWAAEHALAVVKSCRFNPGKLNNSPVAVRDLSQIVVVSI